MGFSSGVLPTGLIDETSTQTVSNKTLDSSNTISGSSIESPSRLDVKKGLKADLVTYASSASDGQIVFATDENKMYQVIGLALVHIPDGADVDLNTLKISYTDGAAVALNTAKISYTDAAAVALNTAKISYSDAAAVSANTAKISYSTLASDAVALNTAKISADGSVTSHSDITDAGSGAIITESERAAIVSGGNVEATELVSGTLEIATLAEVDAGLDAVRAVTPAGLSTIQSDVDANSAKVSADGSVASHSDVSDAGSGIIISAAERIQANLQTGTNTGDEVAASDIVSGVVELATLVEVDAGLDAVKAVTPAGLATIQADVDANSAKVTYDDAAAVALNTAKVTYDASAAVALNTAKISADGSATSHSDITDAGSGIIISAAERLSLQGVSSLGDKIEITQVGHGFVIGDGIFHNGTSWQKGQANAESTIASFCVTSTSSLDVFQADQFGRFESTAHGFSVGSYYFLSDLVAGAPTEVVPTTGFSCPLFYVEDINTLQVFVYRPSSVGGVVSGSKEGVAEWISGNAYAVKATVWNPADDLIYRCSVANADAVFTGANWVELSASAGGGGGGGSMLYSTLHTGTNIQDSAWTNPTVQFAEAIVPLFGTVRGDTAHVTVNALTDEFSLDVGTYILRANFLSFGAQDVGGLIKTSGGTESGSRRNTVCYSAAGADHYSQGTYEASIIVTNASEVYTLRQISGTNGGQMACAAISLTKIK